MGDPLLRLSSFAVVLPLGGDRAFVGHAVGGNQLVCDGAVGCVLQALGNPQTLLDLEKKLEHAEYFADSPERIVAIVEELRTRGLVTSETPEQEIAEVRRWAEQTHLQASDRRTREQMRAEFAPTELWLDVAPNRTRRAVVLGWCTAEALAPALREEARGRGVALDVVTGFERDAALAREHVADFTVLALGNFRLLAPLFECDSADTVARALDLAVSECDRVIRAAAESTPGPVLVCGCISPQTEPLGLLGSLAESSVGDRVFELNRGIRRTVREVQSAVYLDLDRLFASEGKATLLDDLVAPWAHAGALGGASNPRFHRVVARACFDALEASEGSGQIRCIAVDLDGVLWPGEIADPDFSFADPERMQSLVYGLHGGIHEALRALKARGILLAVVSKNVCESALEKWNELCTSAPPRGPLGPHDFVALKIGWREKSASILELCRELGVSPSALAFIDDNPLERAEVSHALPEAWVLEGPVESTRETLLTSPRFESLERSRAARERAHTTRARLLRDDALARAADRVEFLASLEVRCTLGDEHDGAELDRVAELIARTNQFRTTAERPSRREIERFERSPHASVTTLAVSDRFGSYGVTGVALTEGSELRLLTLSCRVIGAEVHQVLLRAALEACRARAPGADILVRFEDTPHNAPTRRLFDGGDWLEHPAGRLLPKGAQLPALPAHCRLTRLTSEQPDS